MTTISLVTVAAKDRLILSDIGGLPLMSFNIDALLLPEELRSPPLWDTVYILLFFILIFLDHHFIQHSDGGGRLG